MNYKYKGEEMMEDKIIFSCSKHIEIAIDDYVNSEEKAPQMKIVSDEYNKKCLYCDEEAKYILLT